MKCRYILFYHILIIGAGPEDTSSGLFSGNTGAVIGIVIIVVVLLVIIVVVAIVIFGIVHKKYRKHYTVAVDNE